VNHTNAKDRVDSNNTQEIKHVIEWYNLIAQGFVERYEGLEGEYWKTFEEDRILDMIDTTHKTILDLGCGHGRITFRLARTAKKIVGIDISEQLISIARQKQKGLNVNNIQFVIGDATNLPYRDNLFDAIISIGMFEYLQNPSPFLRNINRVLKNDGILIFTFHLDSYFVLKDIIKFIPSILVKLKPKNYYGYSLHEKKWTTARHTRNDVFNIVQMNGFEVEKIETLSHSLPTLLFKNFKMKRLAPLLDRIIGTLPFIEYFASTGIMLCKNKRARTIIS